ncbi:hypothetical protein CCH79_00003012, partial [Gambusia affinis]
ALTSGCNNTKAFNICAKFNSYSPNRKSNNKRFDCFTEHRIFPNKRSLHSTSTYNSKTSSTCEERFNQAFTCLCRPGEVYIGLFCIRVKVFPGLLVWKKEFEPEMADKTSQKFLDTSNIIKDEVREQFKDETEFIGPEVLELRRKETKEKSQSSNIEASTQIIYDRTAEITEEVVKKKVEGIPKAESFAAKSLCDSDTCDTLSTKCSSADGSFTCSCGDGFIETNFSDRLCVARCPAGQIYVNNKCKALLIVVIICSILGGLLIAVVIALPLVLKKSKKKSSKKKEEDIGIPYQSHSIAKAPLSYSNGNSNDFPASVKEPTNSLANSGAPRIPRATANSNWDSRTNLEMTPSNSRQNLIPSGRNSRFNDNQDDMYSFSQNRPKNHTYEESYIIFHTNNTTNIWTNHRCYSRFNTNKTSNTYTSFDSYSTNRNSTNKGSKSFTKHRIFLNECSLHNTRTNNYRTSK